MIKPKTTLNRKAPFSPLPLAIAIGTSTLMMSANSLAQESATVQENVVITGQEQKRNLVEKPSSVKFTQEMVDTPKTINVVTEDLLIEQGITNLNDALRNVSGVSTFGAGEGGGGNIGLTDAITIRGFDTNGSIYADGIRDVAGYSRDTFNTEQIEVAKGSASSIYGKGSAGGIVNLVTKRANTDDDKRQVSASYDQGNMARLTADINQTISENSAIRLNALVTSGGDYHNNGVEKYKTLALAPSFYTEISEQTDVSVNLMYMKQDNTPVLSLPYVSKAMSESVNINLPEGPISEELWDNYYGVPGLDFEKVNTLSGTLVISHKLNNDWNLRSQTRLAKLDRKAINTRAVFQNIGNRSNPNYTGKIDPAHRLFNDFEESSLFVTQLDAIGKIKTGQVKHDLVVGAEIYKENKKSRPKVTVNKVDPILDLINPKAPNSPVSWSLDGYGQDFDGSGAAIYAINTATLNSNWKIGGGLRYEHYKLKGYREVRTGGRGSPRAPYHVSTSQNFLSWNASLNYQPSENGNIYFTVSNAQRPPGGDLESGYSRSQIDGYNSLDPLESRNIEVGTKWSLADDRLLLGAALFHTTSDEYAIDDENSYVASGEKRTRGMELMAAGEINDNLSVSASYTYQNAEVTEKMRRAEEGIGLTAAPKNTGNIWLNYEAGPWTVGGGLEYSSGNTYWRRNRAFFETPSSTLANAMVAYDFNNQLKLQLNVSNLTDKAYITRYSAKNHFKPGTPRNVKLSLNYNF